MSYNLSKYRYTWPDFDIGRSQHWQPTVDKLFYVRHMPEALDELRKDSRWPAFFPSSISLVTTTDGSRVALEKVVGAMIVNRFPYVLALSFCKKELSARHHVRRVLWSCSNTADMWRCSIYLRGRRLIAR